MSTTSYDFPSQKNLEIFQPMIADDILWFSCENIIVVTAETWPETPGCAMTSYVKPTRHRNIHRKTLRETYDNRPFDSHEHETLKHCNQHCTAAQWMRQSLRLSPILSTGNFWARKRYSTLVAMVLSNLYYLIHFYFLHVQNASITTICRHWHPQTDILHICSCYVNLKNGSTTTLLWS